MFRRSSSGVSPTRFEALRKFSNPTWKSLNKDVNTPFSVTLKKRSLGACVQGELDSSAAEENYWDV